MGIAARRVPGVEEAVRSDYGNFASSCCGSQSTQQSSCCAPNEVQPSQTCCETSSSCCEQAAPCCEQAEQPYGSTCCCGSAPAPESQFEHTPQGRVTYNAGYSENQLSDIPQESVEIALGCGNPTAMANLKPGEVVLDIGSGGGIDAFIAARQVSPGGHVIGVDMTPAMIERARAAAARNGLDSVVEFRLGKADALPLEDNSVDVVLSNCVINLCEDKGRVFEEAYRVLKPGGRLEVNDMVSEGALPNDLKEDPANWPGCIFGALPHKEYLDLVKQAGFEQVRVRRSTSGGEIFGVSVYSLQVSAKKL